MSLRIVLEYSPLLDCALNLSKLPFLIWVSLLKQSLSQGLCTAACVCQFWAKCQLKMLLSRAVLFADVAPKPLNTLYAC